MIGPGVEDVKISLQRFGWPDYLVFLVMLLSCVMIGIYFGFIKKKPKKTSEQAADYLVGGRTMAVFPVTMSLIASFISGISLLGTPTEIYVYGVQYMFIVFGVLLMGVVMTFVFLPVFHDLQLTSTYEYLETRFDRKMRLFGSIMFTFGTMAWLPIVIYVPALAFNQVTGINVHQITPVVCIVCIFYTCVGGLKAVVWTDVVQTIMMFGAIFLVMIKGTLDVGGVDVVWDRAVKGDRIEGPDLNFDLKSRHTIWSLLFGGFAFWLKSNAVSQNMIQRYLSLPTLASARKALWMFITGVLILLAMCCYCGLLIYATYYECDPLTTKLAKAKDQLLPLLVMDILGNFPGLPGLFVAGVFSAALSSLSTGLNSMSAVMLEDFFKTFSKVPLTDRQTAYIMRGVVAIFGAICVVLVIVVEKLGSVLQLSMSLGAVTNGPLLGIFTMGVMFPWVHGTGALIGGSTGLGIMAWICAKAQAAIATGELKFVTKPVNTLGCSYTFIASEPLNMLAINTTAAFIPETSTESDFEIYHISYLWYTLLGATITIIVSLIASFIIGANDPRKIHPTLLAPFMRTLLWPNRKNFKRDDPIGIENDGPVESCLNLKNIDTATKVG
ncbi:sodium-coupled monocarboxylate transporter 1 [Bradysia coprophila]|uniref:sodium-coupled monocarboxylate transporter 1 n=1 Tax=Bradysia coprophila TaxID=38358 RepID=UPI00187D94CD|nr:sodium-coupled monocarboxylate transporter 1 [Bradysia coprophila]